MKQEPVDLQEGAEAPVFEAPNSEGRLFRLQDCRGRWVVLYFYPRDHTPGCTREACEFRDSYAAFQQEEAVVVESARIPSNPMPALPPDNNCRSCW